MRARVRCASHWHCHPRCRLLHVPLQAPSTPSGAAAVRSCCCGPRWHHLAPWLRRSTRTWRAWAPPTVMCHAYTRCSWWCCCRGAVCRWKICRVSCPGRFSGCWSRSHSCWASQHLTRSTCQQGLLACHMIDGSTVSFLPDRINCWHRVSCMVKHQTCMVHPALWCFGVQPLPQGCLAETPVALRNPGNAEAECTAVKVIVVIYMLKLQTIAKRGCTPGSSLPPGDCTEQLLHRNRPSTACSLTSAVYGFWKRFIVH